MKNEQTKKGGKRDVKTTKDSRISRLLWANVAALLTLITVTVAVLWRLGLLGSVLASFFPRR